MTEDSSSRKPMRVRFLTILCLVYLGLLLYASLMPFDLVADWQAARAKLEQAMEFWPVGRAAHTSRSDLISNLVLYVPLGLLAATRFVVGRTLPPALATCGAVIIASAVSISVEFAQSFSATRIASVQDFLVNTIGGLAGGIAGAVCGRRGWVRLVRFVRQRRRERPLSLAAALLLILLAADALYPYLPTLDVSQVVANLRACQGTLQSGLSLHPWHHWVVRRFGVYAVLAILLGASSTRSSWSRWLRGAAGALGFAIAVEILKPIIVTRTANVANVLISACGAIAGMGLGAVFAGRLSPRAKAYLGVVLLAGYMVYLEWEPFTFTWDPAGMRDKVPRGAEWLPLYHYAMRSSAEDVRLFARSVILMAAMAYVAHLSRANSRGASRAGAVVRAMLLTGAFGLVMELGQFLLPGRSPTVTDVFTFALGGGLGAWTALVAPVSARGRICSQANR